MDGTHDNGDKGREKVITIFIDGEEYQTPDKKMTANQILILGGLATHDHYLMEIKGNHQESFEGKGEETIHLHKGSRFVSVFVGPTTVSDSQQELDRVAITGPGLFAAQLRASGYKEVSELPDNNVKFSYKVTTGRFSGLEVELGFVVPVNFPENPPTGPHVHKEIHPHQSGGQHPTGGVHPSAGHSQHFGAEWQYWSRPYPNWSQGKRDTARYMAFIHGLWATQ
jgi:hypothetical protein